MTVTRTVSGSFSILSGSAIELLEKLYLEGIKGDGRILGFSSSGTDLVLIYS